MSCLLAPPLLAEAQQPGKVWHIGYLGNSPATTPEAKLPWDAFWQTLQERGYVEGKNITIERRYSEGRSERFAALAVELVALHVDVIMVSAAVAGIAAKQATATTPIVLAGGGDPVGAGLVAGLAHPGGNVTGIIDNTTDLFPKRLELLKEAVPKIARVASLRSTGGRTGENLYNLTKEQDESARALGVKLTRVDLESPQDFDKAMAAIVSDHPDALLIIATPVSYALRKEIAAFAIKHRLPAVSARRDEALAGTLLAYGPSLADIFRIAASYVDRILKGARPADLPVQQPTKFELVINLKTARALGLTIPQSLLLRADEVIQ
jgi:putative ABC transport system substrate-binding protein